MSVYAKTSSGVSEIVPNKVIVKQGDIGIGNINNTSRKATVNHGLDASKYYLVPNIEFAQTTNIAYANAQLSYTLSNTALDIFCVTKGETINPIVHWSIIAIPK